MRNKTMGIVFVAIGIIFLISGILIIQKSDKEGSSPANTLSGVAVESPTVETSSVDIQSDEVTDETKTGESSSDDMTENEKKGLDFEKWVISHFPEKYYKLIDWKGDKIVDGRYPVSSRYPDLEFEIILHSGKIKEQFAVECKWRNSFYEGHISWASQEKIGIYNDYAKERGISVFLVLGVGGEPGNPEDVYIIPLEQAQQSNLTKEYLAGFKRKENNKEFYYFAKNNSLR